MSLLKYAYRKGRPYITVRVKKPDSDYKYVKFLVDTGTDRTLISRSTGLLLGIDYDALGSKITSLEVANLSSLQVKEAQIVMDFDGEEIKVTVWVADQYLEDLLGRKGVFEHFDVLFQEADQQVTFIPR